MFAQLYDNVVGTFLEPMLLECFQNVIMQRYTITFQCIRKVTSHESQSGSRKFNLREPLFCYGSHI